MCTSLGTQVPLCVCAGQRIAWMLIPTFYLKTGSLIWRCPCQANFPPSSWEFFCLWFSLPHMSDGITGSLLPHKTLCGSWKSEFSSSSLLGKCFPCWAIIPAQRLSFWWCDLENISIHTIPGLLFPLGVPPSPPLMSHDSLVIVQSVLKNKHKLQLNTYYCYCF